MTSVLHIGAAEGEIEFYARLGVKKLVYVEPDKSCLRALSMNIKKSINQRSEMEISVIPKACSTRSGDKLKFYANGSGQSSLEKPEFRTKAIVGDHFEEYIVETINLVDIKKSAFASNAIDYCCIDVQGHEKAILCSADPEYLRSNFKVIDVELMTDIGQYAVHPNNWKEVVLHLLKSGFEPLIHPHGITESYIFVNSSLNSSYFISAISAIRDRLMKQFFDEHGMDINRKEICAYSSIGDHMFLPLTHVGGSIHATQLQPFREELITAYLGYILPMEFA
jgi:FkbM family methyltransferase